MLVVRATPSTRESQHQGLFSPVKAHATNLCSDCLCWQAALANDGKQRVITTPNTSAKWCPCQTTTDRHHSFTCEDSNSMIVIFWWQSSCVRNIVSTSTSVPECTRQTPPYRLFLHLQTNTACRCRRHLEERSTCQQP